MLRHSMVVYRNDYPGGAPLVNFAGDTWLDYLPIRMSDTIRVQERLPAGAAAVLINRGHTFSDLFMPIDPTELRWFDGIDGNSSIGEILAKGLPFANKRSQFDLARKFFKRLWLYDQVVFDISQRRTEKLASAGGVP